MPNKFGNRNLFQKRFVAQMLNVKRRFDNNILLFDRWSCLIGGVERGILADPLLLARL